MPCGKVCKGSRGDSLVLTFDYWEISASYSAVDRPSGHIMVSGTRKAVRLNHWALRKCHA